MRSIELARYIIGLSWIYHGVFPKLVQVAPLELAMTATLGFSEEISLIITRVAGVAEILFGILFIAFYKQRLMQYTNIAALTGLLIFVMVQAPGLLLEAFNPVTTNIPLIALSVVILNALNEDTAMQPHRV